jgi:hypothetical protein
MPFDKHWMQCSGWATTEEKEKRTGMFSYKLSAKQQHETTYKKEERGKARRRESEPF